MTQKTRRLSTNSPVQHVKTFSITSVGASETWTVEMTDDKGNVYDQITFTDGGTGSSALMAAGLQAAFEASTNPVAQRITATVDSNNLILTAQTAGVPLPEIELTRDGAGTYGVSNTVVNIGPLDWGDHSTWSGDELPADSDTVSFTSESDGALYSLNQPTINLARLETREGFTGQIGRLQDGEAYYLRIPADELEIEGESERVMVDVIGAACSPVIRASGRSQSPGQQAVMIKGDNLGTVELISGDLGLATQPGDTASVANVFVTGGDASNFVIGSGVTLTTLDQPSGKGEMHCAATTVTVGGDAELTTEGEGAIATLNVHGTVYPNSTGTISQLNLEGPESVVDFSQDRSPRTVTAISAPEGGTIIFHENITLPATILKPTERGGSLNLIMV